MAGSTIADDGATIHFGDGNQLGDVSIGDVVQGIQIKLGLNVHIHQAAPLISSGELLASGGDIGDLSGGNGNRGTIITAPAGAAPCPCRVLVFDGRTKGAVAAALRLELRLRGLESLDATHLDALTAQTLQAELATADAAVVLLSPESCTADALHRIELPAVWARYGRAEPFWIIPLIDGVTSDVADSTVNIVGAHLKDFRALALPSDPAAHKGDLATLAGLLLQTLTSPRLRQAAAARPLALSIFSYPVAGATPPADLLLAWDALFPEPEQPTRPPPMPAIWQATLDPVLRDVRLALGASQAGTLSISGRYHLPVGLALGFRLRDTANIILQIAAQPGGVWQSDGPADDGVQLQRKEQAGTSGAPDISIEVSLARDVRDDAGSYLAAAGMSVCKRVQLTSDPVLVGDINAARRFIKSPTHARQLAAQIANIILSHGRGTIHLFAAVPQGLAVLIGAQLNRARPVQCYELFDDSGAGRIYVPSCLLR